MGVEGAVGLFSFGDFSSGYSKIGFSPKTCLWAVSLAVNLGLFF